VVEVKYPGLVKNYDEVERANRFRTACYLTWKTGRDWSEDDVDELVRTGGIALDAYEFILTSSVVRYLLLSESQVFTAEQAKEVLVETRQTVNRIGNLMARLVNKVEVMAVRPIVPTQCPHAPKRRKN
jgi:hypothetical protein